MDADQAVDLARNALIMTLMLATPIMGVAMLTGLLISIGQAVTQIQDQTLTFVPKIVVMVLTILFLFPWSIALMVEYSTDLFAEIPFSF